MLPKIVPPTLQPCLPILFCSPLAFSLQTHHDLLINHSNPAGYPCPALVQCPGQAAFSLGSGRQSSWQSPSGVMPFSLCGLDLRTCFSRGEKHKHNRWDSSDQSVNTGSPAPVHALALLFLTLSDDTEAVCVLACGEANKEWRAASGQ